MNNTRARYVFGLGTGRCGTVALARALNAAPEVTVSHELDNVGTRVAPRLPWQRQLDAFEEALQAVGRYDGRLVGDVASFWLPYAEDLLERYGSAVKLVILWRDRDGVVDSFERKAGIKNHWVPHKGVLWAKGTGDPSFPKYPNINRREAIGRYWDVYQDASAKLAESYPDRVMMLHYLDALSVTGLQQLAEWLDVTGVVLPGDEHLNHRPQRPSLVRQWLAWRVRQAQRAPDKMSERLRPTSRSA